MYDSYGYGQPMMQQMQMRQNDWQQRMQARNAPRYEVIQVNGENGARAFAMAPNSSALLMDATAPIVWLCTTDGVAIPGATATGTATAAGDAVNLSIVSAPRKCGCGCPDLLTVELSAAGTVDNMALVIERV